MQWPKEILEYGRPDRTHPSGLHNFASTLLVSLLQDNSLVRLLHWNGSNEYAKRYEKYAPLCPSPASILGYETSNNWPVM